MVSRGDETTPAAFGANAATPLAALIGYFVLFRLAMHHALTLRAIKGKQVQCRERYYLPLQYIRYSADSEATTYSQR